MSTLQTLASFIFVLGVLIFVHELGHFLMARLYGVRVLRFSLGFDPKLIKFTRGGTEYSVGLIPLGGFVKLAGETVEDRRTGAPDEFLSKSKWVRLQVYLAGPIMNMILAVLLLTVVISRGVSEPTYGDAAPIVGAVGPDSPASKAGVKPGDRIVRIDDLDVQSWKELQQAIAPRANRDTELVVVRDGERLSLQATPGAMSKYEIGTLGVAPPMRPQITVVNLGGPADRAGLQSGDVIAKIDGQPIERRVMDLINNTGGRPLVLTIWREELVGREAVHKELTLDGGPGDGVGLQSGDVIASVNGELVGEAKILDVIHTGPGRPIALTVERQGEQHDVTVVPEGGDGQGLINVKISPYEVRRIEPSLAQAFVLSTQSNWETAKQIGTTLKGLFRGKTPVKQLMGPVAIAGLAGTAAKMGWMYLFDLMAMISLNLGLINLLPIPIMDGGQIAILGFEGLIRRELSMKLKERILLAGAALVVLLMVTVIYNDIMRLVK